MGPTSYRILKFCPVKVVKPTTSQFTGANTQIFLKNVYSSCGGRTNRQSNSLIVPEFKYSPENLESAA